MNDTMDVILVKKCNQTDGFRTVLPAKLCVRVLTIMVLAAAAVLVAGAGVGAAEKTWYVDDGGGVGINYTSIQAAVGNASEGDTIEVRSGTYYENVNVDKQLVLIGVDTGEGKPVVDAGGSESTITLSVDCCVVDGFYITGSGSDWGKAGIRITSEDNEIVNNTVSNNYNGIFFEEPSYGGYSSNNNTVTNNTVCYNNEMGIYVYRSHNNTITNNTANSNINDGIKLTHSSYNIVTNNVANSNKDDGFGLSGDADHNTLINNTANLNYESGIELYKSSNNNFVNNSVSGNEDGFGLSRSSNNTLISNTANSNTDCGFYLNGLSNNNTVTNNNISSNNDDGINMDDSFHNIITNNIILNNSDGVYLDHSSNNTVTNNTISLNSNDGIELEDSANNNTIIGNTISSNEDTGIGIELSNNNQIYHNNFLNNADQADDDSTNFWDNRYLSGGNYWSDHTCTGNPSDGSQPYTIGGGADAVDRYPFENMNGWSTTSQIGDLNGDDRVTPADAAIALQLAATGAHNPAADVSGDGHVTSLDALMILQAAAENIEL